MPRKGKGRKAHGGGAGAGPGGDGGGGGAGPGGDAGGGVAGPGGSKRKSKAAYRAYIAKVDNTSGWYEDQVQNEVDEGDGQAQVPNMAHVLEQMMFCRKAEQFVANLKRWCKPPQQHQVADLKEFHLLDFSPAELRRFYAESWSYFCETYKFLIIPGKLPNDEITRIPMTPEMEHDIQNVRHHIVNIGRLIDEAVLQLLVVEFSGYCTGFRVLYGEERDDPSKVPWCVFNDHTLPDFLKPWHNIAYTSKYKFLAYVNIEDGIGDIIFSFLETFRNRELDVNSQQFLDDKTHLQYPTPEGELLCDTLFVMIAEGRRFGDVAAWILSNLGRIPRHLVNLIPYWLKSCRCVYYLFLYLLEDALSGVNTEETKAKVIDKWTTANVDLSHLELFSDQTLDVELLYRLSGGQLQLLRNAPDLFDSILMRRAGYDGPRMEEIQLTL